MKLLIGLLFLWICFLTCDPVFAQSVEGRIGQGREALKQQNPDLAKQHLSAARSGIKDTQTRILYYRLAVDIAEAEKDFDRKRIFLDSLLMYLQDDVYATDRLAVYRAIAFSYIYTNQEKYQTWLDSVVHLARQLNDTTSWVTGLLDKTGMYQQFGQLDAVADLSREVLAIPGVRVKDRVRAWLNLGMNTPMTEADTASTYFQYARELLPEAQDSMLWSTYYQTYGNFLRRKGELTHATQALLHAIEYTPDGFGSDLKKVVTLNSIARIFQQLGDIDKEHAYLIQAINMAEQGKLNYRNSILAGEYGQLLYRLGQASEGEQELRKAIATFQAEKKTAKTVEYMAILGRLLVGNSQMKEASMLERELHSFLIDFPVHDKAYHDALLFRASLALEKGNNKQVLSYLDHPGLNWNAAQKRDYYGLRIRALENLGQFDLALKTMRLDNHLRDSLDRSLQEMVVYDIESRYRQVEKEKEITDLRMTNEVQALRLSQKNQINAFLVIGLLLF